MKTPGRFLALAVLIFVGCASAASQQSPFTMTIHTLTPENGVATSPQAESIVLEVSMRNNSDRTLLILEGNPAEDYSIEIRDQLGSHPADTEYGLKLKRSATSSSKFMTRNMSLRLKPGEAGTDVIPIGSMYDMRVAGKYFVTVKRKLPNELGQGTVTSNEITITVAK